LDSELEQEAIRLTSKPATTKPGTGICEKEMGLCISQCKMPLFGAKTNSDNIDRFMQVWTLVLLVMKHLGT